jgi:hypothetical protein
VSAEILQLQRFSEVGISIDASAFEQKALALDIASSVIQVKGETDQLLCVGALTQIKKLLKLVESSRQMVKAPVLDLGRKLDDKARQFAAELMAEADRLERLLSAFQAEQRRIAAEVEAKRQAELRRIEADRVAAEREAQRKANEAALAAQAKAAQEAAAARNAKERLAAQERALQAQAEVVARQEAESARIGRLAQDASLKASQAPIAVPLRADGMRVRELWRFEVLDARAVYNSHPELCGVEVSQSLVNNAMRNGLRECPGLRIWKEVKAGV